MEYHEAANFLFDLGRYSSRTGIESTRRLLSHLGNPQEEFRTVQIAGSNGKGSTARMVERVLREAGLSVGLYTSPHLDDLRERVRIDGRKVTKRAVREFVESVEPYATGEAADDESPTFFETVTALALWAFARADVDVAVLEVGIGGRYDATSAVDPNASAVTSVTLEHADVLGETVEEIARDKAAVAPAEGRLVTAAGGDALEAIEDVAGDVCRIGSDGAADVRIEDRGREGLEQQLSISGDGWSVDTRIPLVGTHQVRNAGVAAALAREVASVSGDALERGLRSAHLPGRFEVMEREPLVVLDGVHNPGGCESVAETLSTFEYDELHLVFGAMSDKDHQGMAAALPRADRVYTCRPDLERAETPTVLKEVFERAYGAEPDAEIRTEARVEDALESALSAADEDDAVLVAGSLFVVAEARRRWTRLQVPRRVPDLETAESVLESADVPERGVRRIRGSGIHRVVSTRLQPQQAAYVERELVSLGGECGVSGIDHREKELVDVVLTGTLEQFENLLEVLEREPRGLSTFAGELRGTLGLGDASETHGYPWEDGTAVMGILNVTPDSFHDGGRYEAIEDALVRAEEMVDAGADIVDVGGESTRPGAEPVSIEAERDRVVPVVEEITDLDAMVSVDTRKAAVAESALEAGADIVNDVSGLDDPEMRLLVAERDVPVIVMHSIETPVDPDTDVEYDDVVAETIEDLLDRVLLAEKAGIDRSKIIVDPGLGFGKSRIENFELLGRIGEFDALGCPVLVGHSHKSMFGLVGRGADERLSATVAASALVADRGADIVRVHDVEETVAAVRTVAAANDPDRFREE